MRDYYTNEINTMHETIVFSWPFAVAARNVHLETRISKGKMRFLQKHKHRAGNKSASNSPSPLANKILLTL